ncbi:MAG TPA: FAD-dependent oxidoreductase [Dehalococcoidia bacterium]|nr:FAD-dependent oxidoreductase [Dehalococcoidia bacterium]
MPTTYLLIGGGLAGAKAAEQLRRQDSQAAITLVSDEAVLPYDHPPLSKELLRGEWPRERVFFQTESFYREQGITLRIGTPARRLDLSKKKVTLADGANLEFDKLLLATGARPRKLRVPGAELPGVHYLRTLSDCEALTDEARRGRRAVVIGAGFIGMEVAASLTQLGVQVTVLEAAPCIWSRFLDEKLAGHLQRFYESKGISFRVGVTPTAVHGEERARAVTTASGEELPCDFVCVGVGVEPNTELATEAGLKVENGVVANEYLETSHPDVYAAGDVVSYYDPVFEKQRRVEHWGHAEYTGLLAAQNMAGERSKYDLLSYVWSDIFDLHLEFAGEEKEYDQLLVRGSLAENAFIVLYVKLGILRAYLAINASQREFPPLQRMIRRKVDLSAKAAQIQDPGVELRSLL